MPESWSEPPAYASRANDSDPRRGFDRLVSAGRQLVDGVSGARPGSRGRRSQLDGLGRWVENKLDWILEDDDDWREPWQETRPEPKLEPRREPSPPLPSRRRPLDAISRRTAISGPTPSRPGPSSPADPCQWPDDETFTLPRWQRQASSGRSASSALPSDGGPVAGDGSTPGRALPRSTRRR